MEGCLCRGLPWWLEPPCAIDVGPEFLLEFCPGWWVWMACDGCSGAREMPGGFDMINGCELAEVGPLPSSLSAFIISTIVFLTWIILDFQLRFFVYESFFCLVSSFYILLFFCMSLVTTSSWLSLGPLSWVAEAAPYPLSFFLLRCRNIYVVWSRNLESFISITSEACDGA